MLSSTRRPSFRLVAVATSLVVTLAFALSFTATRHSPNVATVYAAPAPPVACQLPDQMAATPEQTAWQLFVAVTCSPGGSGYPYTQWETWQDQTQVYPSSGTNTNGPAALAAEASKRFHVSKQALLRQRRRGLTAESLGVVSNPEGDCNPAQPQYPGVILCEEVRINPVMVNWLKQAGQINVRPGQIEAALHKTDIEMPKPSIEVKVDWVKLKSCSPILAGIHIEHVGNTCYAMAAMHLSSKLLTKWVWATFEPQVPFTNPDRCKVLGCTDRYGSLPASSHGAQTAQTPALKALMQQANLASEWTNYRLDGVQIDYLGPNGKPTLLGNSVIEGENAGVPLTQASCISCHAASSVSTQGVDGITLLSSNPVGSPQPLPSAAWIRRDFLWSALLAACPPGTYTPATNCPFPAQSLLEQPAGKVHGQ